MRSSVRPPYAVFSKAAGRYGYQRIRSKSHKRARCSERSTGFPHPDLFDHFAHSGHRLLTLPLPSLIAHCVYFIPQQPATDLCNLHS